MLAILDRIVAGRGRETDLEELERLGRFIKLTALCAVAIERNQAVPAHLPELLPGADESTRG